MKYGSKPFVVMLAMAGAFLFVANSRADEKAEPVTIVSHVDIKPDAYLPQAEENSAKLFRAEIAATKQDPGLVSYAILQETAAPNHFTIVETWRDANAFARHVGSEHTVKFRQDIQPYLGSPFDSRIHHQFR